MLTKATRDYFAKIGRKGGQKSRRALSAKQARQMVAVRLARAAYRRFGAQCFWPYSKNVAITARNAAWVAEQLRRNGNTLAWQTATRIQTLLFGESPVALPEDLPRRPGAEASKAPPRRRSAAAKPDAAAKRKRA